MNLYIVRVTNNTLKQDRMFVTTAESGSAAIYNVKSENAFWNRDVYTIRVEHSLTISEGMVVEVKA